MFVTPVPESESTDDLADYYRTQRPAWGFLPNCAAKAAADAASVVQADIDRLRRNGLSEADVADIVYAASARSFFTRVLDGLGAQLDSQTADALPAELLPSMTLGRPVANGEEP